MQKDDNTGCSDYDAANMTVKAIETYTNSAHAQRYTMQNCTA